MNKKTLRSRNTLKRSRRTLKRSRRTLKRSRRTLKRSRNTLKRNRNTLKRSRRTLKKRTQKKRTQKKNTRKMKRNKIRKTHKYKRRGRSKLHLLKRANAMIVGGRQLEDLKSEELEILKDIPLLDELVITGDSLGEGGYAHVFKSPSNEKLVYKVFKWIDGEGVSSWIDSRNKYSNTNILNLSFTYPGEKGNESLTGVKDFGLVKIEKPELVIPTDSLSLFPDFLSQGTDTYALAYSIEYYKGQELGRLEYSVINTINLLEDLCAQIQVAHSNNIVHRDIKPDNIIMFQKEGKARFFAKLIDWDMVVNVSSEPFFEIVGDGQYYSPELIQAYKGKWKAKSSILKPADMFALGVTLNDFSKKSTSTIPKEIFTIMNSLRAVATLKRWTIKALSDFVKSPDIQKLRGPPVKKRVAVADPGRGHESPTIHLTYHDGKYIVTINGQKTNKDFKDFENLKNDLINIEVITEKDKGVIEAQWNTANKFWGPAWLRTADEIVVRVNALRQLLKKTSDLSFNHKVGSLLKAFTAPVKK